MSSAASNNLHRGLALSSLLDMAEGDGDDVLSTSFEGENFTVYPRRWFILLILAVLQLSNAMVSKQMST